MDSGCAIAAESSGANQICHTLSRKNYRLLSGKRKSLFSDPPKEDNPAIPRDAATVIVVRSVDSGPVEILFMQRSRSQSFMGGATVFPGGALDAADADPALTSRVRFPGPADAVRRLGEEGLEAASAVGLHLAAVRETFEECGLLLGLDPALSRERLPDATARRRLLDGEKSFLELAQAMDWRFDLSGLVPWSRWVTPESEKRRFDTRFLVAALPGGQTPVPDDRETTRLQWLTPHQALVQHRQGEIRLMPPTLVTVAELSRYTAIAPLLSAAAGRRPPLIQPKIFISGDEFGVRLPNDPQYDDPEALSGGHQKEPSRVVMRNGRWQFMSMADFHQGENADG